MHSPFHQVQGPGNLKTNDLPPNVHQIYNVEQGMDNCSHLKRGRMRKWETYSRHWFVVVKTPICLLSRGVFDLPWICFLGRTLLSIILTSTMLWLWEGFPFLLYAMISFEVGAMNYFLLGGYTTFIVCFVSISSLPWVPLKWEATLNILIFATWLSTFV